MKVIIDGVFNHCGSFNKWLDKEHIYRDSTDEYAPGAFERYESPYHNFLNFILTSGLIITHMMAGGDMIRFLSLIMRDLRNLKNISCLLAENGFLRHTMLMAGDLMWRLT